VVQVPAAPLSSIRTVGHWPAHLRRSTAR
jgi:hypothetical protein